MRILILSVLISLGTVSLNSNTTTTVYICTGPKAKVYHRTSNCSGLNSCSGNVISVSISKAKEMGRRACKKCY